MTSTALLLWCKKTPEREPIVYGNPKGPTHDIPVPQLDAGPDSSTTNQNAGPDGGTTNHDAGTGEDASTVKPLVKDAGRQEASTVVPRPTVIQMPGNPKGSMHDRGITSPDEGVKR